MILLVLTVFSPILVFCFAPNRKQSPKLVTGVSGNERPCVPKVAAEVIGIYNDDDLASYFGGNYDLGQTESDPYVFEDKIISDLNFEGVTKYVLFTNCTFNYTRPYQCSYLKFVDCRFQEDTDINEIDIIILQNCNFSLTADSESNMQFNNVGILNILTCVFNLQEHHMDILTISNCLIEQSTFHNSMGFNEITNNTLSSNKFFDSAEFSQNENLNLTSCRFNGFDVLNSQFINVLDSRFGDFQISESQHISILGSQFGDKNEMSSNFNFDRATSVLIDGCNFTLNFSRGDQGTFSSSQSLILSNSRIDLTGGLIEFYQNNVSELINCEVVFRADSSICISDSLNASVSNCEFSSLCEGGCLTTGLDLGPAEEIVVSDSVFSNLHTGINMPLWDQQSLFPITISQNTFQNCHIGMFLGGIGSYDIKYNHFLSNDMGLYFQFSEEPYAENKLSYNKFEGNTMDIKSYSEFWPSQYFIEFEGNEFDNPKGSQWSYSPALFKVFFYGSIAAVAALILNFVGKVISKLKNRAKNAGDEVEEDNLEAQTGLKNKEAVNFDW